MGVRFSEAKRVGRSVVEWAEKANKKKEASDGTTCDATCESAEKREQDRREFGGDYLAEGKLRVLAVR
ncbi:MAG: hypothetical protein ABSC94_33100 [Polyangiaceae bacterium]|jgi:hypothetical protein